MHRFLHGAEAGRNFSALSAQIRRGQIQLGWLNGQFIDAVRQLAKYFSTFILIAMYVLGAGFLYVVYGRSVCIRQKLSRWLNFCSRLGLRLLGVQIHANRWPASTSGCGRLILANHLSYLDVLLLGSCYASVFVTSVEIRKTPGLGHLARLGACLFVERRSKFGLLGEIEKIKEVLKAGNHLTIFPEGTSSNGARVLPFKSSLLAAAVGLDIQPVCIRYRRVDGKLINERSRERICWYGDKSFLRHLWQLVGLRAIEAQVQFLPIVSTSFETRQAIASHVHAAINSAYLQPISTQTPTIYDI